MKDPYLIAEIGVNFYDTAKSMGIPLIDAAKLYIDKASEAGVDCVKFQSYKSDTIVSKNSPAYWDLSKEPTKTQYELFSKHDHFNEEDYKVLSQYAHDKGVDFTSTPFDVESADYLESMVDFYKISSSDFSNYPFIRHIARKGKPILISSGASYLSEVDEVIRILKAEGCKDIIVLHCVLSYPTSPEDANLSVIKKLKDIYPDIEIGYSDHVAPDESMITLTTAYLLGAKIIETHFTLDKTLEGNDHYHACDPDDFIKLRSNINLVKKILGNPEKTVLKCEETSRKQARRSLVLTKSIKKGHVITKDDIIAKRPGTGISPKFLDIIIGRKAKSDLEEDTVLNWDLV